MLDSYIEKAGLVDSLSFLAVIKVQYNNAEKAIKLSLISWDQYKIDNSKVVVLAIDFANELCRHIIEYAGTGEYPLLEPLPPHLRPAMAMEIKEEVKITILIFVSVALLFYVSSYYITIPTPEPELNDSILFSILIISIILQ